MICPHCSVGQIAAATNQCTLCGFRPSGQVAVGRSGMDDLQEAVHEQLEGRFRIDALLRRRPSSVVYVAHDARLDRLIALKVVPRQAHLDAFALQRIEGMARRAASVSHPHLLPVFDFGITHAFIWYSMEYARGHSLAEVIREHGRLTVEQCVRIVEPVAAALDYLHRRGGVHGNLKPSNILFEAGDVVPRVSDFWMAGAGGPGGPIVPAAPAPEYRAPEQFQSPSFGPAADQYSLGVVAYECLAGTLPFIGDAPEELGELHGSEPPPRLAQQRPDVPAYVSDAVVRAMAKSPGDRFASVLDFVAIVKGGWPSRAVGSAALPRREPSGETPVLLFEEPPRRLRVSYLLTAAAGVLLGASLALLFLWDPEPRSEDWVVEPPIADPFDGPLPGAAPLNLPGISPGPAIPPPRAERAPTRAAAAPPPEAVPAEPRAARPAPPAPSQPTPRPEPGRLFVNAVPWGALFVDGELVGNTPRLNVSLTPGSHVVRVEREGFEPFEQTIEVAPGQDVRLTDLRLRPLEP